MKKQWMIFGLMLSLVCAASAKANDRLSDVIFADGETSETQLVRLVGYETEVPAAEICCEPQDCSAWAVGAEMPLLNFYSSFGSDNGGAGLPDFNTNAALRLTAAYQTAGILGFRGRYFDFSADGKDVDATTFETRSFDLEATTSLNYGNWNITPFGGVRWTDISFSLIGVDGIEFDGFGTTFGVDAKRNVGSGFALVGGVRQSFLFGDTEFVGDTLKNVVVPITEFRIGGQYGRELGYGVGAIAGLGYEYQHISNLTAFFPIDIGLGGPVFSLTFVR